MQDLLSQLSNAYALILDLRDGYGAVQFDCLKYFSPTGPGRFSFKGPVAVLINSGTKSGKEIVAYQLRKKAGAILIGETTGGAVLGASLIKINKELAIYVPTEDIIIDGIRLESSGVDPDIYIKGRVNDSKDESREAAVAYLTARLRDTAQRPDSMVSRSASQSQPHLQTR